MKRLQLAFLLLTVPVTAGLVALCVEDRVLSSVTLYASIIVLGISSFLTLRTAAEKGVLSGQTLAMATFMVTYPVSAVVHCAVGSSGERGFYDLSKLDLTTRQTTALLALCAVLAAQVGLVLGLRRRRHVTTRRSTNLSLVMRPSVLAVIGALICIIGIHGTVQVFGGAPALTSLLIIERGKWIGSGMARYAFTSTWFTWGITFIVCAFFGSRFGRYSRSAAAAVGTLGVIAMIANMYWTGGRAENLMAAIPLLIASQRLNSRASRTMAVLVAMMLGAIIAVQTSVRIRKPASTSGQVLEVLDWQMGRFSMVGLAIEMTEANGFVLGSTLVSGTAATVNAPSTLFRVPARIPEPFPITAHVGQYLFSDARVNGVVPGTVAELYINFGLPGVLAGFYIAGRLIRALDERTRTARTIGTSVLSAYTLVMVCTWMIPMTFDLWVYFTATRGFPLIVVAVTERLLGATARQRDGHTPAMLWQGAPSR